MSPKILQALTKENRHIKKCRKPNSDLSSYQRQICLKLTGIINY